MLPLEVKARQELLPLFKDTNEIEIEDSVLVWTVAQQVWCPTRCLAYDQSPL